MKSYNPKNAVSGGVSDWIAAFKPTPAQTDAAFLSQFVETADSRFIEIDSKYDGNQLRYSYQELESTVFTKDWLDLRSASQLPADASPGGIFRLAILPLNTDRDDIPPLSWTGLKEHLELLHLRNSYAYSETLQAPPSWFEVPLDHGFKGFMMKPEKWDSDLTNFNLSVAYHPTRRYMFAVAHVLRRADAKYLARRVQALQSMAWHPLLVALILVETRTERMILDLNLIKDSLYSTEKRTGTHKNYHGKAYHKRRNYYAYGKKVWEQNDDFETAPGILTSIISDCSMFEGKCTINEELLCWLEELNSTLIVNSMTGRGTETDMASLSKDSMRSKISFMKTWVRNNRTRSAYFSKRAEAQMQAALSLIAQRDSALNFKLAEAAIRDSSDMRAIAWVTLAFLPATFVATFFSTGFFNFEPSSLVSNWVWLYFVVSVFLSASVLGGWSWWTRRELNRA
ncbi:hypothetical protein B0J13DRAFT_556947 [Dactylonectria estremocensis]|uniref:Uncharacterized protein n=1 Tax=Dactylonectria estremocensis TaxID=1079267 RepID=A0A9P9J141_9HYPO|nr:hypothetical protein B0J13DRAFT_556947 [Dactylonectria estremocensis]